MLELIIGPRRFSTWSLRAWLIMKRAGAEFSVREIDIYAEHGRADLARLSASRRVPILKADDVLVTDSLAIALWCAERYPKAGLWPGDAQARWHCYSAVCEMHSEFQGLRSTCGMGPFNSMFGPERSPLPFAPECLRDIARLSQLLRDLRATFGRDGPYLFGSWSIADAYFTPMAARLRHFQVDLSRHGSRTAQTYLETLLAQPHLGEWTMGIGGPAAVEARLLQTT